MIPMSTFVSNSSSIFRMRSYTSLLARQETLQGPNQAAPANTEEPCQAVDRQNLEGDKTVNHCTRVQGTMRTHVERKIRPHQAEVPPALGIEDIEATAKELVGRAGRAVIADVRRIWVGGVPSHCRDERVQILPASLAGWWRHVDEFLIGTVNLVATKCCSTLLAKTRWRRGCRTDLGQEDLR